MKKIFVIILLICSNLPAKEIFDCRQLTQKVESKFSVPKKLLNSISLTESGRTQNGILRSWPWTLNVNGEPYYFESKNKMMIFLRSKISQGISNIDIGCMQINYKYHFQNFKNLEEMADPFINVKYAASFLAKLFDRHKSWNKAISFYHSSNPKRMKNYLNKVLMFWNKERQRKFVIKKLNLEDIKSDLNIEKKIKFFKNQFKNEKKYM